MGHMLAIVLYGCTVPQYDQYCRLLSANKPEHGKFGPPHLMSRHCSLTQASAWLLQ